MTMFTSHQAYLAMYVFLVEEYKLTGSGEIGGLLGGMSLLVDGHTADPAAEEQWNEAVQRVLAGHVDAQLRFVPLGGEAPG
ncbi:hypothetical protein KY495_06830 [Massilia sp. PAMC28688]|uniref:hypothetical protein n=1 Tax=Massilia sp. PAMC28688 TaxID=2861283 RepID=UPI001C62ECA7|nr:hypothetical protein [Massilia sp. PAMC28688]QYF94890.1 hypothetical protein KY495_06830 [Massilia sp. PAMC28688]